MKQPRRQILQLAIAAATAGLLSSAARADILSAKRGFADTGANYNNLQATGAGWYYTWGTGAANPGNFDVKHYPMFWGSAGQTTINNALGENPDYILGYNEPERSDQSNLSVASAISNWTTISNSTNAYNSAHGTSIKLVSPAVADTGGATGGQQWLANFMSQANTNGLKVDAVAFHWYGVSTPTNPSGAASSFLSRVDSYHNSYNKPVFITEFAIHDWGNAYTDAEIIEANRQFLNIVVPGLESRSYVAGYSWYNWFSDSPLYSGNPAVPTAMGYSYIGALGSGTTANVSNVDLGEHVAYLAGGTLTISRDPGTVRYLNALANTSTIAGSGDWGVNLPTSWVRVQPGATLRKMGSNQITFGGQFITNNGVIEIREGALRLTSSMIGSGSINISSTGDSVGSTARLELPGNITVAPPITFAQRNDPGASDGIRNVSGNNLLAGKVTLAVGGNQARVRSDAGQLTLSGGITTNAGSARNLYLQGAGNGVVSGAITDNASDANGTINVYKEGAGMWTLSAASTYTGATTVNGGTLRLATNGAVNAANAMTVNGGGTLDVAAGRATSVKLASLGIAAGGAVDLNNNDLVVGSGTAKSAIEGYVSTSRNGGTWDATGGITSSSARANPTTGLGVLSGAEYTSVGGAGTFSGQNYGATDTLVKYTYNGDANLDGRVTFDDYVKIDTGFNTSLTGWLNGDFNYSGAVNFDDYVLIDIAFNQQNGTLSRAIDWISGDDRSESGRTATGVAEVIGHLDHFGSAYGAAFLAAVPEPTSLALLGVPALVGIARRKRRGASPPF